MSLIPHTRGGTAWRFLLGAVIVIAFTATTTAVAGLLQFKDLAQKIAGTPALKTNQVVIADPGHPQTLLLIGSDHRAGQPFRTANTDTMMLVRLNPDSSTINVLSIPRDLRVQIPAKGGAFTARINSAYSVGGPDLLLRTIHHNVFPGLRVNHIIDVNFGGFTSLVNAIGCVYVDVDHRYYNNTLYTNYSSIDIQPGYQKVCGDAALAFVRFRHTDSDLVRNARQQDFLRWVKSQYSAAQLVNNRGTLVKIFGQHAQTDRDLHSTDGLINLFNLVAFSAGHQVRAIPFPAIQLPCGTAAGRYRGTFVTTPCYLTANPGAEQAAFRAFMRVNVAAKPKPKPPAGPRAHRHRGPAPPPGHAPVMAAVSDGQAQADALGRLPMPIMYPAQIATGSRYCTNATCTIGPVANSYPRAYAIHGRGGGRYAAYRMTLVVNPILGEYYGVQGTNWRNPPILNSPTETRVVGGKRLLLYFNGHKLSLVAWRTRRAVYWISNSLTDSLSNSQILAMAASLTPRH